MFSSWKKNGHMSGPRKFGRQVLLSRVESCQEKERAHCTDRTYCFFVFKGKQPKKQEALKLWSLGNKKYEVQNSVLKAPALPNNCFRNILWGSISATHLPESLAWCSCHLFLLVTADSSTNLPLHPYPALPPAHSPPPSHTIFISSLDHWYWKAAHLRAAQAARQKLNSRLLESH